MYNVWLHEVKCQVGFRDAGWILLNSVGPAVPHLHLCAKLHVSGHGLIFGKGTMYSPPHSYSIPETFT